MMKLIFFGTQDWSADFLELLIQENFFEIVGVVTQPDKPIGRKHILTASPVKKMALKYGLPLFQPPKLNDQSFLDQLKLLEAQLAVVIAYGRILPKPIIDLIPLGFINVHPSLLPRWRGPSPVHAAILAGDTQSGVTIMKIDQHMDHGPVLSQMVLPVESTETPDSFMKKVQDIGGPFFIQTIKNYVNGLIEPKEQQHDQATFCSLLTKEDGRINWNQPAEMIERKIRAYHPWPGTWTQINFRGKEIRLKILKAVAIKKKSSLQPGTLYADDTHISISTGDGILQVISLQPEGKSPMNEQAFLTGYASALDSKLDSMFLTDQAKIQEKIG